MVDSSNLMLGDIILNYRNEFCPVTSIATCVVEVDDGDFVKSTYMVEDLYPVDLSEKIIKQLGWEENPSAKTNFSDAKVFSFPLFKDFLNIVKTKNGAFFIANEMIHIDYLHQLQHFLRQCTMFKVKLNGGILEIV